MEWLFCIMAVAGALYALHAQQLMRGVLGLALFFIALAGFFATFGAWYLAAGQLFLFVGGVVSLFVLAFNAARIPVTKAKGVASALISVAIVVVIGLFLPQVSAPASISFASFGLQFFVQYGLIINVALLILFSALISAQYLLEDA